MDFDGSKDLQDHINLGNCQILTPPEVRRNEEKYLYFSSFFPVFMCAAFFSTHRKTKTSLRIVFVQEGVSSSTETILPSTQEPVHHGPRDQNWH